MCHFLLLPWPERLNAVLGRIGSLMPPPSLNSKRIRLAILGSVIWLVVMLMTALIVAEQCNRYGEHCSVNTGRFALTLLAFGVLPLLLAWGVYWVRTGAAAPSQPTRSSSNSVPEKTMSELLADRLRGTAIRRCKVCERERRTRYALFNENISYFFARRVRTLSGFMCFRCMTKKFAEFELKTLLFTWWGLIGFFVGPAYLLENLGEYIKNGYHFVFDRGST